MDDREGYAIFEAYTLVKDLQRQLLDARSLIRRLTIVGGPKAKALLKAKRQLTCR